MKKSFFKKSLSTLVVFLMLAGSANAQSINWTPPSGPPLGNNVPAPVNIGDASQTKSGSLWTQGNLTAGKAENGQPGSGIFSSKYISYLDGLTVFNNSQAAGAQNFLVSFLVSAFFNDVYIGDDGGSTAPKLSVNGGFQFVPRTADGDIIPYQPGHVLSVDGGGNASWVDPATLGTDTPWPTCAVGQVPQYQQIDDDNYTWGCVTMLDDTTLPTCTAGQILEVDSLGTWSCGADDGNGGGGFVPPLCTPGQVYGVDSLGNWGCLSGGTGGDLPACTEGQIIKVDDNGVWSCSNEGGLPNGTFNGQILAWDGTISQWVPAKTMQALGNQLILGGSWPGGGGPTTVQIGSYAAGTNVKLPLGTNNSRGKFLYSVADDGTVAWNDLLKMYPFQQDSSFNILELSNPTNGKSIFINNGWSILRDEVFLSNVKPYPGNENELARLCIDFAGADQTEGAFGEPADGDDGQLYRCKGEAGFVYTYLGNNNYENSNPADPNIDNYAYYYEDEDGNPQYMYDVQTNGNGRSFVREWVVPDEIYSVTMQIASGAGGGGGGGAGHYNTAINLGYGGGGGGGGGSGYMAPFFDIPVTPGETLCIFTGRGGKGGYGVANKRYRPLKDTITNTNLNDPNNFITAKTGQNGGNSFVARPPVGGDCSDVDPNNPILPQGAGIVVGGLGGKGGDSNAGWTDLFLQAYDANMNPIGSPIQNNSVDIPLEITGRHGGAGGLAGFVGQTQGYNGSSGMDGTLNLQQIGGVDVFEPGRGGRGGAGGASGLLSVQTGGEGGDNFYPIPVDVNKDGFSFTGNNPQNPDGEKARGLGQHGKNGTTHFVSQQFPGGGSGGGGAARGMVSMGSGGGTTLLNAECIGNPPVGQWVAFSYEGEVYGSLPNSVSPAPAVVPGGFDGFGLVISGFPPLFAWIPCNMNFEYSTPYALTLRPQYTLLDFDGDGVLHSASSRESWGSSGYLVMRSAQQLPAATSSISAHMSASGYDQNQINAYLDNMCLWPFYDGGANDGVNGDSWQGYNFPGTEPELKVTNLSGCGGDGADGGHGNVMMQY